MVIYEKPQSVIKPDTPGGAPSGGSTSRGRCCLPSSTRTPSRTDVPVSDATAARPVVVRHGERELTGTLLPGEPWAAAAARIAAPVDGEPVAHDLSGDTLRFDVEPDRAVYLRAMTRSDLPALTRWLQAPRRPSVVAQRR